MSGSQSGAFLPIAAMMFAAGIGIPVFAAFNSSLGKQLGGPVIATAAAFAVGLVIALVLVAATGFPKREAFHFDVPYVWFGAVFILFYGVSVTYAAPRIGLGNAIFFVLVGQLISAATIDHFGLFGALRSAIDLKRTAGIALMIAGVYLARKTG